MKRREFIGNLIQAGTGLVAVRSIFDSNLIASSLFTSDSYSENIQILTKYVHDTSKEEYFVSIGSYQQHYRDSNIRGTHYKLQIDSGDDAHNIKFLSIINRSQNELSFFDIGADGHVDLILKNDNVLFNGDDVDALSYVLSLRSGLIVQPSKNFHIYKPEENPDSLYHAELVKAVKKLKES